MEAGGDGWPTTRVSSDGLVAIALGFLRPGTMDKGGREGFVVARIHAHSRLLDSRTALQ